MISGGKPIGAVAASSRVITPRLFLEDVSRTAMNTHVKRRCIRCVAVPADLIDRLVRHSRKAALHLSVDQCCGADKTRRKSGANEIESLQTTIAGLGRTPGSGRAALRSILSAPQPTEINEGRLMSEDKTTSTIQVSGEVSDIVTRLAAKKAADLKLPKLSRRDYAEMIFKELAEKEL